MAKQAIYIQADEGQIIRVKSTKTRMYSLFNMYEPLIIAMNADGKGSRRKCFRYQITEGEINMLKKEGVLKGMQFKDHFALCVDNTYNAVMVFQRKEKWVERVEKKLDEDYGYMDDGNALGAFLNTSYYVCWMTAPRDGISGGFEEIYKKITDEFENWLGQPKIEPLGYTIPRTFKERWNTRLQAKLLKEKKLKKV